jgi:hypothetical protein
MVAVVPLTVHTAVVVETKAAASPDDAVALTCKRLIAVRFADERTEGDGLRGLRDGEALADARRRRVDCIPDCEA